MNSANETWKAPPGWLKSLILISMAPVLMVYLFPVLKNVPLLQGFSPQWSATLAQQGLDGESILIIDSLVVFAFIVSAYYLLKGIFKSILKDIVGNVPFIFFIVLYLFFCLFTLYGSDVQFTIGHSQIDIYNQFILIPFNFIKAISPQYPELLEPGPPNPGVLTQVASGILIASYLFNMVWVREKARKRVKAYTIIQRWAELLLVEGSVVGDGLGIGNRAFVFFGLATLIKDSHFPTLWITNIIPAVTFSIASLIVLWPEQAKANGRQEKWYR